MEIPELAEEWPTWSPFFYMFLDGVDRRTGSFLSLPFAGGTAEQPLKTMRILRSIQGLFFEKLENDMKQIRR